MILSFKKPYPPQQRFLRCTKRRIGYGGARGGGKSWAVRLKAILLALNYPGIQILLVRRTYPELKKNHLMPLLKLTKGIARYKDNDKTFTFDNGSVIHLGYCKTEKDILQYQGQSYDVIIMDEATQFTELMYTAFTECNRLSGFLKEYFEPRMYFTCNPGGVGHEWVKRLFITKEYTLSERAEDYEFFPAKVYDNEFIMEHDKEYIRALESIPDPQRRKAYLDGDWDVFLGQYFTEFKRDVHVVRPFVLPQSWRRYVSLDYGLDMLACYFIAVDEQGRAYVYKEIYKSGLIVSDAAKAIKDMIDADEKIEAFFAPPDLWNKHSDTGKSTAEIFAEKGIYLYKANNNRVQGWYELHEWLKVYEDEQGKPCANLRIFENCTNLARTLPALQFDEKNPNDCAKEPHELTHAPDAIRYFIAGRPINAQTKESERARQLVYEAEELELLNFGG